MMWKKKRADTSPLCGDTGAVLQRDNATIYSKVLRSLKNVQTQMLNDTTEPTAHTSFQHEHRFSLSKHIRLVVRDSERTQNGVERGK